MQHLNPGDYQQRIHFCEVMVVTDEKDEMVDWRKMTTNLTTCGWGLRHVFTSLVLLIKKISDIGRRKILVTFTKHSHMLKKWQLVCNFGKWNHWSIFFYGLQWFRFSSRNNFNAFQLMKTYFFHKTGQQVTPVSISMNAVDALFPGYIVSRNRDNSNKLAVYCLYQISSISPFFLFPYLV